MRTIWCKPMFYEKRRLKNMPIFNILLVCTCYRVLLNKNMFAEKIFNRPARLTRFYNTVEKKKNDRKSNGFNSVYVLLVIYYNAITVI